MNKKLFYGATAVVAVTVGGYLAYRHVKTKALELDDLFLFDDDVSDEELERIERALKGESV